MPAVLSLSFHLVAVMRAFAAHSFSFSLMFGFPVDGLFILKSVCARGQALKDLILEHSCKLSR